MTDIARDTEAGRRERDTSRLEAFSDGVFAIAVTLLVLELVTPELGEHASAAALRTALAHHWPAYLSFVTSFATILIMWVSHHDLFRLVKRVTPAVMFANGFMLLTVTAVPFPTSLVGTYLTTPAAATASAVYAALFVLVNVSYNVLWWAIRRSEGALDPDLTQAEVSKLTGGYLVGLPIYLIATAAAFWNAYVSLGICFGLWVFWAVLGQLPLPLGAISGPSSFEP